MYHITKSKSKTKPFSLVLLGRNSEPLNSATFATKQACFKNIQAVLKAFHSIDHIVAVQDDTLEISVRWDVTDKQKGHSDLGTHPKYVPGRNPKNKKANKRILKGEIE